MIAAAAGRRLCGAERAGRNRRRHLLGGLTSRFHRVRLRSICFRRCTLSLQPGIPRPRQLLRRYGVLVVGWAMIAAEEASADPSAARSEPDTATSRRVKFP